jgi:hypothetical protein
MSTFSFDAQALEDAIRDATTVALDKIAIDLQAEIRIILSRPGTGRVYRVAKGRRRGRTLRERGFYRASAPGQPPAVRTGLLRNSWAVGRRDNVMDRSRQRDRRRPSLRLGSAVTYAALLETGTVRMAARPYVEPVVTEYVKRGRPQKRIADQITKVLAQAFRPRGRR